MSGDHENFGIANVDVEQFGSGRDLPVNFDRVSLPQLLPELLLMRCIEDPAEPASLLRVNEDSPILRLHSYRGEQ